MAWPFTMTHTELFLSALLALITLYHFLTHFWKHTA